MGANCSTPPFKALTQPREDDDVEVRVTMEKRELKGLRLLELSDSVKLLEGEKAFIVRSESNLSLQYRVEWKDGKWVCGCKDFIKRGRKCKHIWYVIYWLALRSINAKLKGEFTDSVCPKCRSRKDVVKKGFRYNLSGPKQVYYCNSCRKSFTEDTCMAIPLRAF
jgi:Zn finger protein HypA/HybF involved in hydrogenase expression